MATKLSETIELSRKEFTEKQNNRDGFSELIMFLTTDNVKRLKREFLQAGLGLNMEQFVLAMQKCLGEWITDETKFAVQCIELFKQVDVNDDGSMEWDEFTSFMGESGVAEVLNIIMLLLSFHCIKTLTDREIMVAHREYKRLPITDPTLHQWVSFCVSFTSYQVCCRYISRVYYFPPPLHSIGLIGIFFSNYLFGRCMLPLVSAFHCSRKKLEN